MAGTYAVTIRRAAFLWIALAWIATRADAAAPVSFSVNLMRDGQATPVSFRAWLPDGVNRIKGLMLNLPGSNADTRNITTNGSWQAMLPGMGFGIVGMRDVL